MKLLFILTIFLINLSAIADNPVIAVATNFNHTMNSILSSFEEKYNQKIDVSYGSTGGLYAQILNGAPFDAFFSADSKTIDLIISKGLGVEESNFTYAHGILSFICKDCNLAFGWEKTLSNQSGNISIANPRLAPYGKSAVEALKSMKEFSKIKKRVVYGSNVAQAYQYVNSGNVPFGLVSKSLVIAGNLDGTQYKDINSDLYSSIKQSAIILKRTTSLGVIKKFMSFMKSKEILVLIKNHGYKDLGELNVK